MVNICLLGDYLNGFGLAGFGRVTMCVDITGEGVYPNSLIRITLNALYAGTKVFARRIEIFPYTNTASSISFWWGQLIGNWGSGNIRDFKARFEGTISPGSGISAPRPWYP